MKSKFIRFWILLMVSISYLFFSENIASAALQKRELPARSYAVYLTNPVTKEVTVATKGADTQKTRVLALCRSYIKSHKNTGIQCLWDGMIIFSKKPIAPRKPFVFKKPTLVQKPSINTSPISTISPVATKTPTIVKRPAFIKKPGSVASPALPIITQTLDGYIDGRIVLTEQYLTEAKSLETCGMIMRANPTSEIMCLWGGVILDTRVVATVKKVERIELISSSVASSNGGYLSKNKEQEIGIFALHSGSGNDDARIESITVATTGSARLRTLVDYDTSARLIDLDTGNEITATVSINDTSISFTKMSELFPKNTTKNYKVVLNINSMQGVSEYSTIALMLDPQNVRIVRISDSTKIEIAGSVYTMKSYIIGKTPPTLSIANIGENLFRITATNTDQNYPLSLREIVFSSQLLLPIGSSFAGTACLRDIDTHQSCGTNGTSTAAPVPSERRSIVLIGSTMNTYVPANSSLAFELYIGSNDIFPTGGRTEVTIESLGYLQDTQALVERYQGNSTLRATYSK